MLRSVFFSIAFVAIGQSAFGRCADLIVSNLQALDNAYRATGGLYKPLSGRYMYPSCLVAVNYNKHALSNVRNFTRRPHVEPFVTFYDSMRDFKRDDRDRKGFSRFKIVLGVAAYTDSSHLFVIAAFMNKFGEVEAKHFTRNISGWGNVDIVYLFRPIDGRPGKVRTMAFVEVAPPPNSMAARSGVKKVYGETHVMIVEEKHVALPAYLLADVLTSVQLPALSGSEYFSLSDR